GRAVHRDRLRHAPLAAPPRLAARTSPEAPARQARPLGAQPAATRRVSALLPRPCPALGRRGRGGEPGPAQGADAGPRRVRQRRAPRAHSRRRAAPPPRPPGRSARDPPPLSRLDPRALGPPPRAP